MARPRKLLNAQSGNLTTQQREEREKEEEVLYNYEKLDFSFIHQVYYHKHSTSGIALALM